MTVNLENLTGREIKNLIQRGILEVMESQPIPTKKEETPEYKKHKHLKGKPIHLSGAARKYDVPLVTISQWVKKGYISVMGMDKNKKMLDEADVAYCAEVRKNRQGQGKWLFDESGLPYTPETTQL